MDPSLSGENKQCCGSGIFIPDPDQNFSIPYSGSRVKKITDPGFRIRIKEFKCFNPKNCVYVLGKKLSVMFIPDPGSGFLFQPGPKKHRIPDTQHWDNHT
jgi:hypothetical protein